MAFKDKDGNPVMVSMDPAFVRQPRWAEAIPRTPMIESVEVAAKQREQCPNFLMLERDKREPTAREKAWQCVADDKFWAERDARFEKETRIRIRDHRLAKFMATHEMGGWR